MSSDPALPKRTMTWPTVVSDRKHASVPQHSLATSPPDSLTDLEAVLHEPSPKHFLSSSPSDMGAIEQTPLWQPSYPTWRHDRNPYHEYDEDDSSDDDSDCDDEDAGNDAAWSAGITDFSKFDAERRAAADRHEALPGRWNGLIERQRDAMKRAVARSRACSDEGNASENADGSSLDEDEVPFLTPEGSPALRFIGEMDAIEADKSCASSRRLQDSESSCGADETTNDETHDTICKDDASGPDDADDDDDDVENYLFSHEDDDDDDDDYEDENDPPLALVLERARRRRLQLSRPGLRYNRTLSGKVHVWQRPSGQIYTVGEEDEQT